MFRQFGNCNSPFGDPDQSKMIVELIQKMGLKFFEITFNLYKYANKSLDWGILYKQLQKGKKNKWRLILTKVIVEI